MELYLKIKSDSWFLRRAIVGEVDEDAEADINLADIVAEPLKPILQGPHHS